MAARGLTDGGRSLAGWRPPAALAARRPDAVPLGAYLGLVRRYRVLLALGALVGLAAGLFAASRATITWVSTGTVLAPAVAMDPEVAADRSVRPREAVTIDSEASLLMSLQVLRRAVAGTGVTPDQLAVRAAVTAAPNSRVLTVTVQDTDRARAQLLTSNLLAAYLDSRAELLAGRRSDQADALRRRIAALKEPSADASAAYTLLRQADARANAGEIAQSDAVLQSVTDIAAEVRDLRRQLGDLQSRPILAGELLRAATRATALSSQPSVPVVSWLLVGLSVAGLVAAAAERRPRAPRTGAQVARLPAGQALAVGLLVGGRPGPDPAGSWVRMADAIGSRPAAVLVVPVDGAAVGAAVENLALVLRRRGYEVCELLDFDHEAPGSGGATATVRRVRAAGQHVICEASGLEAFRGDLSATVADAVVLVLRAGAVTPGRLGEAVDRVARLGVPVVGVVLERDRPGWWAPGRRGREPVSAGR